MFIFGVKNIVVSAAKLSCFPYNKTLDNVLSYIGNPISHKTAPGQRKKKIFECLDRSEQVKCQGGFFPLPAIMAYKVLHADAEQRRGKGNVFLAFIQIHSYFTTNYKGDI